MSQNDFVVADQTFPSILADFNAAFQALASASSGAAAPATSYAYQLWADTTDNLLKMRNGANNAWMILAKFDTVNDRWEPRSDVLQALSGSGLTLRDAAGVALATFGAGTINLNTAAFTVKNAAGTVTMLAASENYRVVPKYGNTDRFWTTATGAEINGALEVDTINGAALAGGFTATVVDDGTKSAWWRLTPVGGNFRKFTNGGAHAVAAPNVAGDYNLTIRIVNNASAGAITFSEFATAPKGDALTTTDTHKFNLHVVKLDGVASAIIEALQ